MDSKYTILVVDDTIINVDILVATLGDEYNIMVALNGEDAIKYVDSYKIDLVLLDIMMPYMDGYEVCKIIKSKDNNKNIPIIFITAKNDEQSMQKAFEVGGIDFITKPFMPKEVELRVKTHLQIKKLIEDLHKSREELREFSIKDPLTGLYNRRYFSNISEHTLNRAIREKHDVYTVMIDIDNFKSINDIYGHSIGDKVIIYLSNILKESTRKVDSVCRWGGEEFLILLVDTNTIGAYNLLEKIRVEVEESYIKIADGRLLNCTISIGISKINSNDIDAVDTSIINADKALYSSKHNGKNKITI